MWILSNSKGDRYYLLTGRQHTVGRKDTDLLLREDQSISRKHAILNVEHKSENWANPQKPPVVKLIEAGAKYGTSVIPQGGEKQALPADSTFILKDGDQIQFGLQWNLWKLEYKPLVVSLSTLSSEEKRNVKAVISKLGGHVVDTWSSACTHLTMCSITLTIKAVCALADGKPIVTPEMWNKYLASAEANLPIPDYEEFIPPLGETTIKKNEVSFKVNEKRKTLFRGKKFLFFTRAHCNQHQCLVLAAGGTPVCIEDTRVSKQELISPDVIVMQVADRSSQSSQMPSFYADYINYLQASSRRLIPVSEIGLAILHCSLEKYCNPAFSFASKLLQGCKGTVIQDSSEPVLALDTQEAEALCGKIKASSSNLFERKKIIPASGTSDKDCESTSGVAQRFENDEHQNTGSMDITPPKQVLFTEPHARLQERGKDSPLSNKMKPLPSHSKRRSDEELAPSKAKRQRISVHEGHDAEDLFAFACDKEDKRKEEDLFAFASDKEEKRKEDDLFAFACGKEEKRNEEDLFAFSEDLARGLEANEPTVKTKTGKRKMPDNHSSYNTPKKKSHLDSVTEPGPSKECPDEKKLDTQEEFISICPKVEVKEEEDDDDGHITIGVNKTTILLKNLVIRKNECSSVSSVKEDNTVENFKKFRKARLPYQRSTPHIIGGKELILYETATSSFSKIQENGADSDEVDDAEHDQWAFQPSQKSKRVR
ncbi:nibrin [Schistocerca nitens]|uniref:nibrin n=1 Tax=Schistocerca nitens TaxID=7011 RepID=UPI0021175418|nr:nibrin [Schistocerca nitens]